MVMPNRPQIVITRSPGFGGDAAILSPWDRRASLTMAHGRRVGARKDKVQ
jgi:hypothetical protein